MYVTYFDESGTHAGCPSFTVAGWISPIEQWKKFDKEWKKILDSAEIPFFHMTDYENRKKFYKEWDNDKRISILSSLHRIIRKRTVMPISASVPLEFFEKIKDKYREPNSIYVFCLYQCLLLIEKWANDFSFNGEIDYVMENGSGYGTDIGALFTKIRTNHTLVNRFRFSSWKLGDKKSLLPLQAADILAYESHKEMINFKIPGEAKKKLRLSAENLIRDRNNYCVNFERENLEKELQRLSVFSGSF